MVSGPVTWCGILARLRMTFTRHKPWKHLQIKPLENDVTGRLLTLGLRLPFLLLVGATLALVGGLEDWDVDAVVHENLAGVVIGLLVQGDVARQDPSVLELWGWAGVRERCTERDRHTRHKLTDRQTDGKCRLNSKCCWRWNKSSWRMLWPRRRGKAEQRWLGWHSLPWGGDTKPSRHETTQRTLYQNSLKSIQFFQENQRPDISVTWTKASKNNNHLPEWHRTLLTLGWGMAFTVI